MPKLFMIIFLIIICNFLIINEKIFIININIIIIINIYKFIYNFNGLLNY